MARTQDAAAEGEGVAGLTPKARRTRARLVEAATEVFSERMYLDTNVAEIVERAGVAHGTFYTYFSSKEDVFREVAQQLQLEMLQAGSSSEQPAPETLLERIEATNRAFLETYMRNAKLMAVVEQVATFSDELREIRREIRNAFVERSRRAIARMQADGLASTDVDPRYAASALGSMIDRFAYVWLVLGEDFDFDESVRTLSILWVRALGIEP